MQTVSAYRASTKDTNNAQDKRKLVQVSHPHRRPCSPLTPTQLPPQPSLPAAAHRLDPVLVSYLADDLAAARLPVAVRRAARIPVVAAARHGRHAGRRDADGRRRHARARRATHVRMVLVAARGRLVLVRAPDDVGRRRRRRGDVAHAAVGEAREGVAARAAGRTGRGCGEVDRAGQRARVVVLQVRHWRRGRQGADGGSGRGEVGAHGVVFGAVALAEPEAEEREEDHGEEDHGEHDDPLPVGGDPVGMCQCVNGRAVGCGVGLTSCRSSCCLRLHLRRDH